MEYPSCVVSSALLQKFAAWGVDWELPAPECRFIAKLNCGQSVFGGGLLISQRLAAERERAERLAISKKQESGQIASCQLDESERQIVQALSKAQPGQSLQPSRTPEHTNKII